LCQAGLLCEEDEFGLFSPTGTLGIGKKKHILVLMTRKTNILLLSVTAVSGFHEDFF
jgi:hypothetical protein